MKTTTTTTTTVHEEVVKKTTSAPREKEEQMQSLYLLFMLDLLIQQPNYIHTYTKKHTHSPCDRTKAPCTPSMQVVRCLPQRRNTKTEHLLAAYQPILRWLASLTPAAIEGFLLVFRVLRLSTKIVGYQAKPFLISSTIVVKFLPAHRGWVVTTISTRE